MDTKYSRSALMTSIAVMSVATASPVMAQTRSFDVPAQPASSGIAVLARQANIQIFAARKDTNGKRTNIVSGEMSVDQALATLLRGTGLTVRRTGDQTYTVIAAPKAAQVETPSTLAKGNPATSTTTDDGSAEILVTGSRIRSSQTPSSTITFDAERIHKEGFNDLGDVIRSVPQNFGGGQNPGVGSGATTGGGNLANQNLTGGSALNLRGLGPDATLTLLNGRRLSYTGFSQGVDISAIPVDAVERLEIVPDGASAIYGSDAVGGVGNVILKRDFKGLTVSALYGGATDGGLSTQEYNATGGWRWSSGGLLATYKNTTADPIFTNQRDYAAQVLRPTTIYSGNDLESGLISAHQSVGGFVNLHVDAMKTKRSLLTNLAYPTVYYQNENDTTTTFISPGLEFSLRNGWHLSVDASWSRDKTEYKQSTVNFATAARTVSEGCYCNESHVYEIGSEGPLFRLGGGNARLAAGAGYRTTGFQTRSYTRNLLLYDKNQNAKFAYAELNLPLIGEAQNIPAIRRLTLTAAIRGEDYDSFGSVATPKFGIILEPNTDFTLRATWGRSFKAPTLLQLAQTPLGLLYRASSLGGVGYPAGATVLIESGGNPDLKPERARTWTVSLDFHPTAIPSLQAELTYFNINYTDRVLNPIADLTHPFLDNTYSDFINYAPTEADKNAVLSRQTFYNVSGAAYDSSKVVAILLNDFTNAARWQASGIDFSGAYTVMFDSSRLTIRASASWLKSSKQNSAQQPTIELAGMIYNPAELRSRAGLVWNAGGLGVSVFGNYTSGVTNTLATGAKEETGSFLTLDASIRYRTEEADGLLSGLEFALSAQNIFNRTPPLNTVYSPILLPYDSTNYSGVGRFLSASISKHF